MTDSTRPTLNKTLGITQAIGLGVTIVVGSGLLLLPGLAYRASGAASIYVWIFCAVLTAPLLVIFSKLGARYPTAGGIADFMQNAFSRAAAGATEVLLMGTFGLGGPAIALTGGYYLRALLPTAWAPSDFVLSSSFIAAAFAVNFCGAKLSGNAQRAIAIFLVLALLLIPAAALILSDAPSGAGIAPPQQVDFVALLPLFAMVFFAFTGWEMLSFTIEEYKNPRRDYPIAVFASFCIVVFLYLFLVATLQILLPPSHPLMAVAPLTALASTAFGARAGQWVALLSCIVILANLIGAMWAASRLVFSSAREGLLPPLIARIARTDRNQTPRIALSVVCILFVLMLFAHHLHLLGVDDMLRLAGQNFFILYGLSVLAYIKIATGKFAKLFGWLCLIIVGATMSVFGAELIYTACLLLLGYGAYRWRVATLRTNGD